jgi:hypothetical protein
MASRATKPIAKCQNDLNFNKNIAKYCHIYKKGIIFAPAKSDYTHLHDLSKLSIRLSNNNFLRGLLIIVILNEVKNLYPRFTDVRDVSAALNMTFLEQPLSIFEEDIF